MPSVGIAQRVPLSHLTPAPWNPRHIKDDRFQNLCRSIEADPDFLRLRPVLAQADGTIYAGNMRYRAAQHLNHPEVWAVVEDVPEQLAKERALRDNAQWGEWVDDDLTRLLGELKDAGSAIDLLGFDSPELDRLLSSVTPLEEDLTDADLEPPAEPITKPGDLWLLGEHRLLCGDSTVATQVDRLMAGVRPDVLLTDPPYCSGGFQEAGKKSGSIGTRGDEMIANDTLSTRGYMALLKSVVSVANAGVLYVFTDWRMWVNLFDVAESSGYGVRNMIVWDKGTPGMGRGWRSQHELVLCAMKVTQPFDPHKAQGNVIQSKRTGNINHPTEKPVDLIMTILDVTDTARCVYDPFAGSGSTLMAAAAMGRVAYLMEIDPGYCDVIVNRWQKLTGKKALLDGTPSQVLA